MFNRAMIVVLVASVLIFIPSSANADTLLGTDVTGQMVFTFLNVNYFDPANFSVPASGYGNSVSPNNVKIVDPGTEFGYDDGLVKITADFTGSTLTITDRCLVSSCTRSIPIFFIFTDSAFTSPTKVSDSFQNGGLNLLMTGETIEFDWAGFPESFPMDTDEQAVFSFGTPAATPERGSVSLLGLALLGVAALKLKKNCLALSKLGASHLQRGGACVSAVGADGRALVR